MKAKNGCIFLNLIKSLIPYKLENILDFLADPDDIFTIKASELGRIRSLTTQDVTTICTSRSASLLCDELRLISNNGVQVIDLFSPKYPALLKEIPRPPLVLYVQGDFSVFEKPIIAIVGSRKPSDYGRAMAGRFSSQLAQLGFVVVSGLAYGIDTAAHKATFPAGETIAVLGSGLLNVYPRENRSLAQAIIKNGAVISEFPLREEPRREHFPRRNRIISGLAKGVLVIEAAERSGSLITAHRACEQNREVFALPGNAHSPLSKGTHALIKEGATLVDSVEDIIVELAIDVAALVEQKSERIDLSPQEKTVFDLLGQSGMHIEEIHMRTSVAVSELSKTMMNLVFKGFVCEIRPLYYIAV